jgi:NTP pyrophosphatase (non-canonical NTP hydrolase)
VIDINWYQAQAMRTCSVKDPAEMCVNSALGLAGEAGEYCELIKKHLYQGHGLADERLAEEIGDVLRYCAEAATSLGLQLGDIAKANVDKLWRRYPEGFDSLRSEQRGPENWRGEEAI